MIHYIFYFIAMLMSWALKLISNKSKLKGWGLLCTTSQFFCTFIKSDNIRFNLLVTHTSRLQQVVDKTSSFKLANRLNIKQMNYSKKVSNCLRLVEQSTPQGILGHTHYIKWLHGQLYTVNPQVLITTSELHSTS